MPGSRNLRRAVVSVLACVLLPVVAGQVATAASPNPAQQYANEATVATNRARVSADLKKVVVNACLRDLAVAQAVRMATSGKSYNQDLGRVLRACDIDYAGENVAHGYPSGTSVVTQGFMRSSGHRANIMGKNFTMVGVAARRDKRGTWYISEVFGG